MKYIALTIIIMVLTLTVGCSDKSSDEPTVVEQITGAEQIKTYKKTRSKIDDVKKDLELRYQITD